MKELFIHIGLSKTGSSAIQSWLSLNSEKLRLKGVDYADLSPSAKEGKITAGNGVDYIVLDSKGQEIDIIL